MHLTVCYYHVTYAFQSESTLYICLNVKFLAQNRCDIWSLSDWNSTWTHNHLVWKWTLDHLAKLTKRLSCVMSTYLYCAFHCMLLLFHVRISEWMHTLYLPDCQGTPCSKQAWHLNFKWLKQDLNPQPLSSKTNTQQFAQTDQRIEVCCEYLSVQCICIYFIIMWNRHFRVNSYSMFSWMSRNSLFEAGVKSEVWMVAMGLKPTTT